MTAAVDVHSVGHRYGERVALDAVSFSLPRGQMLAMLGPNGSGKSTLFRLLSTLMPLQNGTIKIDGIDVASGAAEVRRKLGVVFQSPAVDSQLTVAENLACHASLFGMGRADAKTRGNELLERLGVADRRGDRVATLSGGLRRRVELAKALLPRPSIILLDEPSTGLDIEGRRQLRGLLRELRSEGLTIALTTHQIDEAEVADQVAILDRGRLVAIDTPEALCGSEGFFQIEASNSVDLTARLSQVGFTATESDGTLAVRTSRPTQLLAELAGDSHRLVRRLKYGPPGLDAGYLALTGRTLAEPSSDPS